ncbi:MAG: hypothetical protein ACK52I_11130 [Pseudomonadota bacterium]
MAREADAAGAGGGQQYRGRGSERDHGLRQRDGDLEVRAPRPSGAPDASASRRASLGAGLWFLLPEPPPQKKPPVSVLSADLRNATGDAALDGTLEPVVKLALDNATFVSAFARSDVRRALGRAPRAGRAGAGAFRRGGGARAGGPAGAGRGGRT